MDEPVGSELAQLRRRIELEEEASKRALYATARVAPRFHHCAYGTWRRADFAPVAGRQTGRGNGVDEHRAMGRGRAGMKQQSIPTLVVGLNDLQVVRTIIQSYLALVRRTVPPSRQRDEEMVLLQSVQRRIAGIPAHTLEAYIHLLAPEVQALNHALTGFASFIRTKVPPSREREAALRDLERFRLHFIRTFG